MSDDLVERVARLYEDAWGIKDHWRARQAIAIALEEAAKVAEGNKCDSCWMSEHASAAIRGLIKEETK